MAAQVFRLEENVSYAMGQTSLTILGNINLNFRLARGQVMHLETEANFNLCANRPDFKRMLKEGIEIKQGFSLETSINIHEKEL